MATESKKLQTRISPLYKDHLGEPHEMRHDARIAHEQREVIQQLVSCLQQVEGCDYRAFLEAGGDAAIAAAAPFLSED